MTEYQWDTSIETGHTQIDDQHRELLRAINGVIRLFKKGKGGEKVAQPLEFLHDYTIKHFFDEEQIQRQYEYPDYENHKKMHEYFKDTVRDMKVQFVIEGPSDKLFGIVHKQIGGWLINHIKTEDKKLAAHIKKQETEPTA